MNEPITSAIVEIDLTHNYRHDIDNFIVDFSTKGSRIDILFWRILSLLDDREFFVFRKRVQSARC